MTALTKLRTVLLLAVLLFASLFLLASVVNANTDDASADIIVNDEHVETEVSIDEIHDFPEGDGDEVVIVHEKNEGGEEVIRETLFSPSCEPACEKTHFCNFRGKCEPYPVIKYACDFGGVCDGDCHCSGKCVDGVCQQGH